MVKLVFVEEWGKALVPKRVIPDLRRYVMKAGILEVPYNFFGILFYVTLLLTAFVYIVFIWPFISNWVAYQKLLVSFFGWVVVQGFLATLFILFVYFYLDLRIYKRTKEIEEYLPDFLQVLSSNLKGGMTFERALWSSIKPRFKVLAGEMSVASKKVMTGYKVGDALVEFSQKYNSPMLKRTIDLIVSELESGGNIAKLIDNSVDNLKEVKALKEEMSASAVAYIIFISLIAIFISPLLFALAFNLLVVILGFMSKLSVATSSTASLPFSISGEVTLQPSDFKTFSVAAIFVISFFSSMIVSIVEKDDIKGGIKYIPIFVLGSIGMYFVCMRMLTAMFGGII